MRSFPIRRRRKGKAENFCNKKPRNVPRFFYVIFAVQRTNTTEPFMSIWLCWFAARMRSPSSTETTTLIGLEELLPPRTCTAFTMSERRAVTDGGHDRRDKTLCAVHRHGHDNAVCAVRHHRGLSLPPYLSFRSEVGIPDEVLHESPEGGENLSEHVTQGELFG